MLYEHEYEPIRGLPERLPEGETILWQGGPTWRGFARRALHLPWIGAYFVLLIVARVVSVLMAGASPAVTAVDSLWVIAPALLVMAIGLAFAWGVQRTTIYTITNRRVVFRIGLALSVTANLPFSVIQGAAAKVHADGSGDVSLEIGAPNRISWLFFWPHVRPWRMARPQPTLRAIPDAAQAAQILARALAAANAQRPVAVEVPQPTTDGAPQAQVA